MAKTRGQVEGSRLRRKKRSATNRQARASFIGTRPRSITMVLRGQAVDVEVVPAVGTTTHVNFEITIRARGKILGWIPTRAELESIGRAVGLQTKQETSH